jgi:predicted enzyme related to lactoylglutathione lyase
MLRNSMAFSGFSVKDLAVAKQFYGETLGIPVQESGMGLHIQLGSGALVFIYDKADHTPATFTILNFPVDDIEAAVAELKEKGIKLEQYEGLTDESGIARGRTAGRGPDIAWFKDPSGNILSILQQD